MSASNDDLAEEVEVDEPLGNPAPPPDVDLEKLRGDRIGDTVFSGKWCIQTVMKLMQSNVLMKLGSGDNATDIVDMDEDLQNEVGALWDMTSNVQVCQYLHSVGAVESICHVISNSRCPRATEMCVGMLANIIYHNELWDILKDDTTFFTILIQLLTSTDQPVLLEVNRFFNTALCHPNSEVFYTSLSKRGPLVTQELLRILSGSTNGDLLKQVTELVSTLMYRDQDDSHFNAHFADPDFVMSVVEASKEIGWTHESSGQNYIMEIFHSFTTYEAGVVAIGSSLEDVSASGTAYLRVLCQQGLSLASSCSVLTSVLSTVHHIMARSTSVKESLLASPIFLHCVLISLVALYRKLGHYHAISGSAINGTGRRKHHRLTAKTTWQSEEDREEEEEEEEAVGGRLHKDTASGLAGSKGHKSPGVANPQASWSERAFAAGQSGGAESEANAFRTPEASPRPLYHKSGKSLRELEVSWSERRLASPLAAEEDEEETQQWKRPKERGRFKRKEASGDESEKKEMEGMHKREVSSEDSSVDDPTKMDEDKAIIKEEYKVASVKTDSPSSSSRAQHSKAASVEDVEDAAERLEDSNITLRAMKIQGQSRTETSSRLSGGFLPSGDGSLETTDQPEEKPGDCVHTSEEISQVDCGADCGVTISSSKPHAESSLPSHNRVSTEDENDAADGIDVGFDYVDKDQDDEEFGGEMNKSVGGTSRDKYKTLLVVLRDFLVDYLNSMSEVQAQQDGTASLIKATMGYLDRQCSSTELRALARCVRDAYGLEMLEGTSVEEGRLALQRLVHLCDSFRAGHLKSVLTACVADADS